MKKLRRLEIKYQDVVNLTYQVEFIKWKLK